MSALVLRCITYMLQDDVNMTVVADRHLFEDITEVRSNKLKELGV